MQSSQVRVEVAGQLGGPNLPCLLFSTLIDCARRRCSRTYIISTPRFTTRMGIASLHPRRWLISLGLNTNNKLSGVFVHGGTKKKAAAVARGVIVVVLSLSAKAGA